MDWGFIFQIALAILGAALTVGGFMALRSKRFEDKRPIAGACLAAGVMMLLIVGLTLPVSSTTSSG